MDDNDVSITGPISTVVADAVAEFTLVTNQFSAEYGHSAGGQFQIVSKSGTNDWHGTAFHFLNNRKLNAFTNKQWEAQGCATDPSCEKPRTDQNSSGGSVGGPIIKDRAFIFGAYQRTWAGFPGGSVSFTAPTASGLANLNTLSQNAAIREILAEFPTAPAGSSVLTVQNLNTGASLPVQVGDLAVLAPDFFDEYIYHINGDINFGDHRLSMRYLNNNQKSPNLSNPPLAQFSGDFAFDVDKAIITDVWSINPRWINDLRASFTRAVASFGVAGEFANFPNVLIPSQLPGFQVGPQGNAPQSSIQNTYQILDQMSFTTGPHTLKWGVESRWWVSPGNFLPRSRGEWRYANLSEFVSDRVPSVLALRGAGTGATDGNQNAWFGFIQDDWKVTPRLTLNLGVRYEWYDIPNMSRTQPLNSIANLPGATPNGIEYIFDLPKTDKNNFAPRLGFAWDVFGNGKTAVRGGVGLSYDVFPQNFPLLQLPPQLQSEQDPDITCSSAAPPTWCATYIPGPPRSGGSGFLANGGLLQINVPPTTTVEARNNTGGIMLDQVMPEVWNWTVGLQRELYQGARVELRYLGTRSRKMLVQIQSNSLNPFSVGAPALPLFLSASAIPASFAGAPTRAAFSAFSARPLAADGFLGGVTAFPNIGEGTYHAGSLDFNQRMWRGLGFRANYTWAHNIDNSTNELFSSVVNPRRPEDFSNIDRDRGRSVLDIRHKFAATWTYQFPKAAVTGALDKVLNGWMVNGTFLLQTGQPVTPQSFVDANGNRDAAGDRAVFNPAGDSRVASDVTTVCWNGSSVSTGCTAAGQIVGYLAANPNAGWIRAQTGMLTSAGRNSLESPGLNNWNMSLFKSTKITERVSAQFRVEAFNVFNHPQFSFANPGAFQLAGINDQAIDATGYVFVGDNPDFLNKQLLDGGGREINLGVKIIF